jgi:hypothetical protein
LRADRRFAGGLLALVAGLALTSLPASSSTSQLPRDFDLSEVSWGGFGGGEDRQDCGTLSHYPVVLVHDDGDGPEGWRTGEDGGLVGALHRAGFDPCEVWALKVGSSGQPLRSLEELTDDVKFFIFSVLAYTRAPQVQLIAEGDGAALVHTTLDKYHLHHLVHAAVYVDGPFQGVPGCDDDRCFGGEVRCCQLQPGSAMLRRVLLPLETPSGLTSVPDGGREGHLRYLALGSTPAVPLDQRTPTSGGWMLDGAANLSSPGLVDRPLHRVEGLWPVVLQLLVDPALACDPQHDADRDGFCSLAHGGNDCDDGNARAYPGAQEIAGDGIDQDCNRHDLDRDVVGWKCERPLGGTGEAAAAEGPASEAALPPPPRTWQDRLMFAAMGLLLLPVAWLVWRISARRRRRLRRQLRSAARASGRAVSDRVVKPAGRASASAAGGLGQGATAGASRAWSAAIAVGRGAERLARMAVEQSAGDDDAPRPSRLRHLAEAGIAALLFTGIVVAALAAIGFDPGRDHPGGGYHEISWDLVDWNVHYWSTWEFRQVLDSGALRSWSEFHPVGLDTVTVRGDVALMSMAGLVGQVLSPANTYLVVILALLIGNGLGGYLLVRSLTGNRLAGVATGLLFVFSGVTTWAVNTGNIEYGFWLWICLYLVVLDRLLQRGGIGNAALGAVLAVLAILTNFVFAFHLVLLSALMLAFRVRRLDRRRWLAVGLLVVLCGALLVPFAALFRSSGKERGQLLLPPAAEVQPHLVAGRTPLENSYSLVDYYPWNRGSTRDHGEIRYYNRDDGDVYWFALAALVLAVVLRPRRSGVWVLAGGAFFVLALGPFWIIRGEDADRIVHLPYYLAIRFVPLYYRIYFPHRIVAFAWLSLGVVLGLVVDRLMGMAARRRNVGMVGLGRKGKLPLTGPTLAMLVGLLLVGAVAWELGSTWGLRHVERVEINPFYRQIGEEAERFALVVFPMDFGVFDGRYLYWQTEHGKALFNGAVPRYFGEEGVPNLHILEDNPILRRAYELQPMHMPKHILVAMLELEPASYDLDRAALDWAIDDLLREGFRYIVVHRTVTWEPGLTYELGEGNDLEAFFDHALGEPAYADAELVAYDLREADDLAEESPE